MAHPADDLLSAYAGGWLHPAPSLVVATHLARCPTCRTVVSGLEVVGGALLGVEPPEALAPWSSELALARGRALEPSLSTAPCEHPSPAAHYRGARRWLGPGRWVAPIRVPHQGAWRVHLVRAPAGASLPEHGHVGAEYTCVLEGGFEDGGVWSAGDFVATRQARHAPQVTADGPCLSLIACEGGMQWRGAMKILGPVLSL